MNATQSRIVFIVGNSRSGTTLVAKILGRHRLIHAFQELHFFEDLWDPADRQTLSRDDVLHLAAQLDTRARVGRILAGEARDGDQREILCKLADEELTAPQVYVTFLRQACEAHGKTIPCEQTPRYVFYLAELLEVFPDAKVVVMLRDPRDILLSQKNKWKQYKGRKDNAHLREMIRLWANYHPILLAQMWKKAMMVALPYREHPRVLFVHFEELVQQPEKVVQSICRFAEVDFDASLLDVAASRSALTGSDQTQRGVSAAPVQRWKKMLKAHEVAWCQRIAADQMRELGYQPEAVRANPLRLAASACVLPFKALLAVSLNLNRSMNIVKSIRRRLLTR